MRAPLSTALIASLLAGCATPHPGAYHRDGRSPSVEHGVETAATGLGQLVVSPFMIAAGLLEGLAALPWLIGSGVHDLNRAMLDTHAEVTLDDTYRAAYGTALANVPSDGNTGEVFHRMDDATVQFHRVLRSLGVEAPERFLLTAIRSADRDGYTLYAVVERRHAGDSVRVRDKWRLDRHRVLVPEGLAWYEPHARTAAGDALDVVVDWAAVPRDMIGTQRGQALLMTLAAHSVLITRRAPDYWAAESRWLQGQHRAVVAKNKARLQARLAKGP